MADASVRELRLSDQDEAPELIEGAWNWWSRCDGWLDPEAAYVDRLYNHFQFCVDDGERFPFLYVGPETTTAMVIGLDWAGSVSGQEGLPDPRHNAEVGDVYPIVSDFRRPFLHEINCTIRPPEQAPIRVNYYRLVLPVQSMTGLPMLALFTAFKSEPVRLQA